MNYILGGIKDSISIKILLCNVCWSKMKQILKVCMWQSFETRERFLICAYNTVNLCQLKYF